MLEMFVTEFVWHLHILRDAELEEDTELFIGPAPPAVVAEAETANEAERFEEVCYSTMHHG